MSNLAMAEPEARSMSVPTDGERVRARVNRYLLLYTPVWCGVVLLLVVTRIFAGWRDLGLMLLGIGLAIPVWLAPLVCERGVPLQRAYATKAAIYITLLSFLQNYFGTTLFFRCFGLTYKFPATILGNGSPIFLSFMTVAYFGTYFSIMHTVLSFAERRLGRGLSERGQKLLRLGLMLVLAYALAAAETLFMANDMLRDFFYYGNKARMMQVGSVCYGTLLFLGFWRYYAIDVDSAHRQDQPTSLSTLTFEVMGVNTLILCFYELYAAILK